MEVYTLGLSNEAFAGESLIEGREWPRGRAEDRESVIPLD